MSLMGADIGGLISESRIRKQKISEKKRKNFGISIAFLEFASENLESRKISEYRKPKVYNLGIVVFKREKFRSRKAKLFRNLWRKKGKSWKQNRRISKRVYVI